MENFESLEIGDSIMSDWAQIISDALDILKFDGAVQDTLAQLREKWGFGGNGAGRSRRCWRNALIRSAFSI